MLILTGFYLKMSQKKRFSDDSGLFLCLTYLDSRYLVYYILC